MNSSNDHVDKINTYKRILLYLTIIACCIILVDTLLLKRTKMESVTGVEEIYQSYYNAASNGHSTYKVTTDSYEFHVNPEVGKQLERNMDLNITVSSIFNQVHSVGLTKGVHTKVLLSGFTGLTLPILIIAFMLIGLRFKGKVGIITFVLQVALLLDLIYLMA